MADNVTLSAGSGGATIKTDDDGTAHWQYVKVAFGADNTQTRVTSAVGMPIVPATGATFDLGATDNAVLDAIDSNTDSGAVVGNGAAATAQRVTLANDSTGVVAATQSGTWNIGTVTAVTAISNALPAGNNNIGDVDVASIAAGDNNIGNVDIVTVPADPFGANADAASAAGSISAKLRFIASTGIPITGTVTISGAVTNAGTFVVQENGAALTALQVIDDWDETDRCKVNPIVGQAGVAAGNGAVTATTQRVALADISTGDYETVAASQTNQALGASGAAGDYLAGVLIVPATTSPGAVQIKDGAGGAITIFSGGASSVSNLVPFFVPLGIISGSGAWQVTTGANVSAIGVGNFA